MTVPQHMTALQKANEIRTARAEHRHRVHALPTLAGRDAVAELLDNPPDCLRTVPVMAVLRWVRRLTTSSILAALQLAGASETRTVGDLTPRQRALLAGWLRSGLQPGAFERRAWFAKHAPSTRSEAA